VFIAAALPVALMALGAFELGPMDLGVDPAKRLLHACGKTALNLLLLTLMVTPVREISGWNDFLRIRRMLGLFAFFYACLHLTLYLWLDQQWQFATILEDIIERPYITLGLLALLLLKPLAVTSTNRMMRRLGKHWTQLHRLIYVITGLGLWHYYWQVKKDTREALIYIAIFALLMAWRLRGKFLPAKAREKT
jgi:methionine sulfoxide reductase heme-binding subunit